MPAGESVTSRSSKDADADVEATMQLRTLTLPGDDGSDDAPDDGRDADPEEDSGPKDGPDTDPEEDGDRATVQLRTVELPTTADPEEEDGDRATMQLRALELPTTDPDESGLDQSTMQLRTVEVRVRAAAAAPAGDASSPAPVFVDSSGRRGRGLRLFGWLVGVVCVGFAAVLITTLMSARSGAPELQIPDQQRTSAPAAPQAPASSGRAVRRSGPQAPPPAPSALAATGLPAGSAGTSRQTPARTTGPVTTARPTSPAASRTAPAASATPSAPAVPPSTSAVPSAPSATAPTHRRKPILPFPTSFPT